MQDISEIEKASIDYPREDELITSPHYTFRIAAPMNAEKVEVCIDGAPWQLCRYSAGHWWYDWTGYYSGEHEIVARLLPFDSRNYILCTRRFTVDLDEPRREGARTLAHYSVLADNEPWVLARVTQLLSKEDVSISGVMTVDVGGRAAIQFLADKNHGLRQKLQDAGMNVDEKEVFHLEISNSPDELNRLVRALAEREIAIRSLLGTVEGGIVKLVLSVDQPHAAAPILEQFSGAARA